MTCTGSVASSTASMYYISFATTVATRFLQFSGPPTNTRRLCERAPWWRSKRVRRWFAIFDERRNASGAGLAIGNGVDFDAQSFSRQRSGRNGRARRAMIAEHPGVGGVHAIELAHVLKEDAAAQHARQV